MTSSPHSYIGFGTAVPGEKPIIGSNASISASRRVDGHVSRDHIAPASLPSLISRNCLFHDCGPRHQVNTTVTRRLYLQVRQTDGMHSLPNMCNRVRQGKIGLSLEWLFRGGRSVDSDSRRRSGNNSLWCGGYSTVGLGIHGWNVIDT